MDEAALTRPPATSIGGADGAAGDEAEASLIESARTDRRAFAALYRLHYSAIVGYLYRRTGSEHAAEDLTAETFMAALGAIGRYKPGTARFRTWLYRIATNAANRWAKRARRQAATVRHGRRREGASDLHSREDDVAAALEALHALPAGYQAVLSLHYLEGLSIEDVAAVLGCRAGAVKSRLSRARGALRAEIERRERGHA